MTSPSSLPKYQQTAELLIRDIASGRLMDGERLPPEREMSAELGISVGTLRKALATLHSRGLLVRVQGSGNYIKADAEIFGVYAFFRLELLEGGGMPTAEVLSLDTLTKPDELPSFGNSTKAHRIRRLRRLNTVPAALEEIWLDRSAAASVTLAEMSESLYLYYRRTHGLWMQRADDTVSVGKVPDWAPDEFGPMVGSICGAVDRIAWDQGGRAVEYSRTWFDPDRVRYVSRLR